MLANRESENQRRVFRQRVRKGVVESVLGNYDFDRIDHVKVIQSRENLSFRVDATVAGEVRRYFLRATGAATRSEAELLSELHWLRALACEAGLTVPEPIPRTDGTFLTSQAADPDSEPWHYALLRWLPGVHLDSSSMTVAQYRKLGELVAKIHRHSEGFAVPDWFSRPPIDCTQLIGDDELTPPPGGDAYFSRQDLRLLNQMADRVRSRWHELNKTPELYGLTHGDLAVDENVLWHHDQPYPIDFGNCGWGFYLNDLATPLAFIAERKDLAEIRRAFLAAYQRIRPLPSGAESDLDFFLIVRGLYGIRLMFLSGPNDPLTYRKAALLTSHVLGTARRLALTRSVLAGHTPDAEAERPLLVVELLDRLRGAGAEIALNDTHDRLRITAPKGALSEAVRRELREHKASIIEFLQQAKCVAAESAGDFLAAVSRIPRPPDGLLPLSFAQERLFFLYQWMPDSAVYNISSSFFVQGSLDLGILERSLNEVVRRHQSLRTRFITVDGQAFQRVEAEGAAAWTLADLQRLSEPEREAVGRRRLELEAMRPFDLGHGPVLRVVLVDLGGGEHLLLISMHHIVSDGWSMGIFTRELVDIYQAFSQGKPPPLPELEVHYGDYALWQRHQLTAEILAEQLDYWRQRLRGASDTLPLPLDRPRPRVRTFAGATARMGLPATLSQGLMAFSRQHDVTLFMVLVAALDCLLLRHTGQEDLLVGTPSAGRQRPEIEDLIGFFVNTLVLRVDLAGDPTFRELLERVREVTLGAYAHQDLPFEKLIEEIRPQRSAAHSPLFQVMIALDNTPASAWDLPALTLSPLRIEHDTAKFELTLIFSEDKVRLEYDREIFEATTIRRMLRHYVDLLQDFLSHPDRRLSRFSLLSQAERHQTLVEWNATASDYPHLHCLHQLYAAQVERTPEACAVVFGDHHLSYRELGRRANRLAHSLRALGVGPEMRVGICAERSLELVVGLLAILKAGGAYLPLNPEYPASRLAFMAAAAATPVVLTQQRLRPALPELEARVVCLDADPAALAVWSDADPGTTAQSDHLAYVIYTSGSTGEPKGSMITHRGIVNRLHWMQQTYRLRPGEAVLQKTPFTFDVSVWEFFWPLLVGARLVVARPGGHQDAAYLTELVASRAVTTLHFVPSMLQAWVEEPGLADCRALRRVIASGEALSPALVERFFARFPRPQVEVHNLYGPTEAAVDVTSWRCRRRPSRPGVPIGGPIANIAIHLLDRHGSPVPIGVSGELLIAGVGLARGYLGRPDLSAERFVPDPVSGLPGARLYRTGDLARRRADGAIEFLGRIDHQVKLRGMRIELGEIEACLEQRPEIRESAVVVRESASSDPQLVAYLVPDAQCAPVLRRWLEAEAEGRLRESARYLLPNGMLIAHKNPGETDFLYQEIFVERTYLRHGITLPADACVFDVGANVGLFALFVARTRPRATVYAFEPLPPLYAVLEINAALYDIRGKCFECGLASAAGDAEFAYFPHVSLISGRLADSTTEREEVRRFLESQGDAELSERELDELLETRLERQSYRCQLRTISEVIRETGVERIDLLKVDVERSEVEVLLGIDEHDWEKIRQVVVEVHDLAGELVAMRDLLRRRGFEVAVEQDRTLRETRLYNVYARRPDAAPVLPSPEEVTAETVCCSPEGWIAEVRDWLRSRLPDYMVPAFFVPLAALPVTANGKLDRRALPPPQAGSGRDEDAFTPPRTPIEALVAAIWAELLGVEKLDVEDNFFALGGHSLLATRAVARLRQALTVDLSIRDVFQSPTVAALAAQLEARPAATGSARDTPILALPRSGSLPLSYAQQRLWFLYQLEPESPAYHLPVALRLVGSLKVPALQASLAEIVRRHESLRTTFRVAEAGAGEPIQEIAPPRPVRLPLVDLSRLPGSERDRQARRRVRDEIRRPFDLTRGPLLRVLLLRQGGEEVVLVAVMHHIVSDGWSLGVLVRELMAVYPAFLEGRASPLPELGIQYADYAVWQRRWLAGEVLEAELAYWRDQLQDPPVVDLPTDRLRRATAGAGGELSFVLSEEISTALTALSRRQGATLFMTLLAAFQGLLYRYTRQSDLTVGTTIAGREQLATEPLIGFFVNTLVLRTDPVAASPFREFLGRVRETTLAAYAHQSLPFDMLVEALRPQRTGSRSPFFAVAFALQNLPAAIPELPDLRLEPFPADHLEALKFDLGLMMIEANNPDRLTGRVEFDVALWDPTTIRRMIGHLRTLLEGIVADPDRTLGELPLLRPAEAVQLLVDWNDTELPPDEPATIHGRFARVAASTPAAVAVLMGAVALSFGELDRRSNQLARYLLACGLEPEERVGLAVERSPARVIALLGILKAGAAYLPLDPSYPRDRLSMMLRDCSVRRILISGVTLPAGVPERGVDLVPLEAIPAGGGDPLPDRACGRQLAYVVYTSGTTGQPKGVGVSHEGVLRLTADPHFADDAPRRRWLHMSPLNFDAAALEIWGGLLSGAGVAMMAPGPFSPAELARMLERDRITTVCFTAAVFHQMVDEQLPSLPPVHRLMAGGDVVSRPHVERLLAAGMEPGCRLMNCYGPTENTVLTSSHAMRRPQDLGGRGSGTVPIGRPLAGTRVYVFDEHLRPLPAGVPGDLWAGGIGVARGYLGRPALTADRFLPDPRSCRPGDRMYRTGDRVRWNGDGRLEFMGRLDHQVKLRGLRIELREIESVLEDHPGIGQVVVVARAEKTDKRLVAYVVPRQPPAPSPSELRRFLGERLPSYMVPAAFVSLEALPVLPTGKLDRRALPAPQLEHRAGEYLPPRDAVELDLVRIWEDLLELAPVSVTDEFFALGGHSLLAVRLMARIEKRFGRKLSLASLLQDATVESLARQLRAGGEAGGRGSLVTFRSSGSRRPLFFVHPVGGDVLCYLDLARALGPQQPFYGLRARGLEGDRPALGSIAEMAACYLEEIRSVAPEGPYWLGGWSLGGVVAFEMARRLGAAEIDGLLLIDSDPCPGSPQSPSWPGEDDPRFWGGFAQELGVAGDELGRGWDRLGDLEPEARLRALLDRAHAQRILAPDVDLPQIRTLLDVYRANLRALAGYRAQPLAVPCVLFQAADRLARGGGDLRPRWEALSAEVVAHPIPGDHHSLIRGENVRMLADHLRQRPTERSRTCSPKT